MVVRCKANEVLYCDDPNPFSDSQARNYADTKISNEFYPTSLFWSLFNDQHEVLLGTRGSGKTFLLKMMRRSMLKRIDGDKAKSLVNSNEYFALYVPMHVEIVSEYKKLDDDPERQVKVFQFFFNCILAEAIVQEMQEILKEQTDVIQSAIVGHQLACKLDFSWFSNDKSYGEVVTLEDLDQKLKDMYLSFDLENGDLQAIPAVFTRQICASLISAKGIITNVLRWEEEPTWIICVDEAEFLNENMQKCINSVFRADSNRIALKVATLPFYHKTHNTLVPGMRVSASNDFSYRFIDMEYDSEEYKCLTNQLCAHRLRTRLISRQIEIDTLEDFLGKVGNDDYIDYYRAEVGEEKSTKEKIEEGILSSFSESRRRGAASYSNKRKTVYDKYAPIFYVREMYKIARSGHSKPGWYAGASVIRKVSQGNPRMFIQIMNALFEKARRTRLTPKAQHEEIYKFAVDFCNSTKGLSADAYDGLNAICTFLQKKVHSSERMVTTGCAVSIVASNAAEYENARRWIEEAIAHSRLTVDCDTLVNGLQDKAKIVLSNAYAVRYWIPMRTDTVTKISLRTLSTQVNDDDGARGIGQHQISLFEGDI